MRLQVFCFFCVSLQDLRLFENILTRKILQGSSAFQPKSANKSFKILGVVSYVFELRHIKMLGVSPMFKIYQLSD